MTMTFTMAKPAHTTDAHWKLVTTIMNGVPSAVWSGCYAHKPGYHYTVNGNLSEYAPEYSSKLDPDLNHGFRDVTRGTDITLSDAEMRKRTGYMKAAAEHPDDDRLNALREFIGTLDSKTVYCLIKDGVDGA